MKRTAAEPRARLNLQEYEHWRHERIGDVRRQVHLQAVQSKQRTNGAADQEMEAVDRQAPDEHPTRDRRRLARRSTAFGSDESR